MPKSAMIHDLKPYPASSESPTTVASALTKPATHPDPVKRRGILGPGQLTPYRQKTGNSSGAASCISS